MRLGLDGRCALVTGGTKGIGFAVAQELLQEGAHVTICARTAGDLDDAVDRLARIGGGRVRAGACDVTDPAQVRTLVAEAAAAYGGLDIVVNNAGGATPGSFAELTNEQWQRDIEIKLFAQINVTREAIPRLRESRAARVVNIGAVYARNPDASFLASSVTRAACHNLTKVLAQEYGPHGILVNAVNVGLISTPQWDSLWQRKAPGTDRDEFLGQLAQDQIPLGRFGTAAEVAGMVAFLAGDRASYITGATIDVAGGMGRSA
ncbi:SDR family oxidoreductase [Nocardioides carbamazepini]|uniref:SDR family NAD(P)-dependent oxidoreductase n=1 Tax=Nocardioides carbamazepini TaxID=2854259 RepID=UPI002149A971|nr:SDR family oxidoreductase [Nocardioides carbamazepini]MCR1782379.1 SDR family oxidoreductase [Nocardioides carbamazepini]